MPDSTFNISKSSEILPPYTISLKNLMYLNFQLQIQRHIFANYLVTFSESKKFVHETVILRDI
jgi:hypothetical protein